jgi:uncharacterized protein (DUF1697 family)
LPSGGGKRRLKAVTEYVALLRGINVGGKALKMGPLVELFEAMKLANVRTYIQSGNVLFTADATGAGKLKAELESRIAKSFGLEVTVILRSHRELKRILLSNPLLQSGSRDSERMHVTFLADEPAAAAAKVLPSAAKTPDEYSRAGKEVYVYCPGGYGKTLYSNAFFEKTLGVRATTRNWRTVNKLCELMAVR